MTSLRVVNCMPLYSDMIMDVNGVTSRIMTEILDLERCQRRTRNNCHVSDSWLSWCSHSTRTIAHCFDGVDCETQQFSAWTLRRLPSRCSQWTVIIAHFSFMTFCHGEQINGSVCVCFVVVVISDHDEVAGKRRVRMWPDSKHYLVQRVTWLSRSDGKRDETLSSMTCKPYGHPCLVWRHTHLNIQMIMCPWSAVGQQIARNGRNLFALLLYSRI